MRGVTPVMPRTNSGWPILPKGWQERLAKDRTKANPTQSGGRTDGPSGRPPARNGGDRSKGRNTPRGDAGGFTQRPDDLPECTAVEDVDGGSS
jgi:hypothetical protein